MKKIVSSVVDVANIHNYSVAASNFFQGTIFLFFLKNRASKKYIGTFLIYFIFLRKKRKIKKYTFYHPTTCNVNVAMPLLHVALVQQYITPCHVIMASIPSRKKSSASMMTRNVTEVLSLTIAVFIS